MKKRIFSKIKCVAFDLDGTLYFGDKLADGALELITLINQQGWHIYYITNNSSRTRQQIYEKLLNLGLEVELEDVMNSSYAVAKYLCDNKFKNVHCLGTEDFAAQISAMGINTNSITPEAIVIGYDPEFNLKKLEDAICVYNPSCHILAANLERTYLGRNEAVMPGAGPIVKSFEFAVRHEIELFIGKPHPFMLELLVRDKDVLPEEILVVGDTYESDVAMANLFGANAVLIYNGFDKIFDKCTVVKNLHELTNLIME